MSDDRVWLRGVKAAATGLAPLAFAPCLMLTVALVGPAGAQQTAPPASAPATAPVPTPPTPAVPPATGGATPAPNAGASGASPPATAGAPSAPPPAAATSGGNLPPVQVIQEKPKPKPVVEEPALKPKKPKPVEAAAPEPAAAPAKKSAAPKPASKPVAAAPKPAPKAVAAVPPPAPPVESPVEAVQAAPAAGSVEAGFIKMSPIGGSEIPIEKVPGGVATVTAKDIDRTGAVTVQDALQTRVAGIVLSDIQGNAFQQDIQYRGFSASPVNGVPQGLAVYQNGVRINEVWGDTINLDFVPSNAINDMTVVSGNPVFGLNAIGGAISLGMKDGFTYQGGEIDARIGSFGRRQVGMQAGLTSAGFAVYAALENVHDDGFRDFSSSNIRRLYADLGVKGSFVEAHVNLTRARNDVGVAAASPVELLDQKGWNATFTTPQTTRNEMDMVSANVTLKPTRTLTLSGVVYYRDFRQKHVDGNIGEFVECVDEITGLPNGTLCAQEDDNPINGGAIPFDPTVAYGSIDRTQTTARSLGGSVQAVEKSEVLGHGNQFLIGASFDRGKVSYGANSELGIFAPQFVVIGTGEIMTDAEGDVQPQRLKSKTNYSSAYVSDTFDVTKQLSLTVGGRFNHARVALEDQTGNNPDITSQHVFTRFNPMAGATYKVFPGLTVFGGYSEANRAPTPAELACADPLKPCIIESFLVADPPLKQVVSHTYEAGLRGEVDTRGLGGKLEWNLGFFRTLNTDDIISVFSSQAGRGYFLNAGETLRQGVELAAAFRSNRFFVYGNYSFVDATFQTPLTIDSPNNPLNPDGPGAGTPFGVDVAKGSKLSGVPAHKFKAGFDYWLTPQWKFGSDLTVVGDQFFLGDEANQNAKLPAYYRIDLHTSYDITKNIQIYGLVNNVLNKKYGVAGVYSNMEAAEGPADVAGVHLTDPRAIIPAAPLSAYGGVKIKF